MKRGVFLYAFILLIISAFVFYNTESSVTGQQVRVPELSAFPPPPGDLEEPANNGQAICDPPTIIGNFGFKAQIVDERYVIYASVNGPVMMLDLGTDKKYDGETPQQIVQAPRGFLAFQEFDADTNGIIFGINYPLAQVPGAVSSRLVFCPAPLTQCNNPNNHIVLNRGFVRQVGNIIESTRLGDVQIRENTLTWIENIVQNGFPSVITPSFRGCSLQSGISALQVCAPNIGQNPQTFLLDLGSGFTGVVPFFGYGLDVTGLKAFMIPFFAIFPQSTDLIELDLTNYPPIPSVLTTVGPSQQETIRLQSAVVPTIANSEVVQLPIEKTLNFYVRNTGQTALVSTSKPIGTISTYMSPERSSFIVLDDPNELGKRIGTVEFNTQTVIENLIAVRGFIRTVAHNDDGVFVYIAADDARGNNQNVYITNCHFS